MKSMTGYGRGESTLFDRKFVVEIKASNNRYLDYSIKLPRSMYCFEDSLKKIISSKIFRGKIEVYVKFETFSKDDFKVTLNEPLAESYYDFFNLIKSKFDIKDNISLSLMSKFTDIINIDNSIDSDQQLKEIWQPLSSATELAIEQLINMRNTEGIILCESIKEKLENIKELVSKIEEKAPAVEFEYKKRLENKLNELQELNIEESRLLTEITIFADKYCIEEEITRLNSHVLQMYKVLEETSPIGKKLDFLVQEMNREANTICSKANDINITNYSVELKSEIEKIREQVQNLE